eukprot:8694-Pelagococcus_subviridis.AAC.6
MITVIHYIRCDDTQTSSIPVVRRRRDLLLRHHEHEIIRGHLDRLRRGQARVAPELLHGLDVPIPPLRVLAPEARVERRVPLGRVLSVPLERPVDEELPADSQRVSGAGDEPFRRRVRGDVRQVDGQHRRERAVLHEHEIIRSLHLDRLRRGERAVPHVHLRARHVPVVRDVHL